MKYLYKKDLVGANGNHKYADFVLANKDKTLKQDDEKYWFDETIIPLPTIQEQITALEVKITPRRLREAMLGVKESITFIEDIDKQIEILREVM